MKLKEISETEFNNLPESKKIFCHEVEFSHKFALLSANDNIEPILLCWRSDFVKPQIIDNELTPFLWFGIDQQVLAINKVNGRIALQLLLATNLLELIVADDSVILRTELEIYSFSLDGTIQMIHHLPEISESIEFDANVLKVNLIDGQSINIKF